MTADPGQSRVTVRSNYGWAIGVGTAVVIADFVTKRWAASTYTATPVEIIGDFLRFRFVENTGAAFSMFEGGGTFFGIAAIVAIGVVLWLLRKPHTRWETVGLGLVLGGAAGNLLDRIVRGDGFLDGAVIDWIDLWFIPTFNLADASITMAVIVLLIGSWLHE